MVLLSKISTAIEHKLASFFGRVAWNIAARPFLFIAATTILALVLATGIPSIKSESEAESLYTPAYNNRGKDDWKTYQDMFSAVEGVTALNEIIAYANDDSDGNLLTPTVLNELFQFHQTIKNLEVSDGSKTAKLADLCVLSVQNGFEQECEFQGVTDLMTGPIQHVSDLALDPALTADLRGGSQVTALFAGGRTVSADGKTVDKVRAFLWTIVLDTGRLPDEDIELQDMWMHALLEMLHEKNAQLSSSSPYKLAYGLDFSANEELDESTSGDSSLLSITFTLVISFSFLIVRSYSDFVLSKGNVVWGAILGIVLAIGAGFGLMGHAGVIFNPVVSTSTLLLLGLGMDNAYVLIQAWHVSADELSAESTVQMRLQRTFETAGVSIFFTSFTDIIAFAVGISSSFPAVRGFCAYTAAGVFFTFLFQLLFFGAVLAIDGHREYCGQTELRAFLGYGWLRLDKYSPTKDLSARLSPGAPIPVMPEVAAIRRVTARYGRALLQPWCSAAVLAAFAGYVAYAVVGVSRVGTGLDLRDLAATDSYWTVFVNRQFDFFFEKGPPVYLAFPAGAVEWGSKEERGAVLELLARLEGLDCLEQEPRSVWLREFHADDPAHSDAEGHVFYAELRQWLDGPGFKFRQEVLMEETAGGPVVTSSRVPVRMMRLESTSGDEVGVPCMRDSREILDPWQEGRAGPAPLFVNEVFQFWEASAVIVQQTSLNLVYAAAGCFVVTLLVLPHPVLCCLAMLVVAMILAGVVGTMSLILDLRIETISMINLVLSIGFSIDNVAHYCHAYMASKMKSRQEKALDALERIGWPILVGDASTMIALLPLLGSKSQIFRSFFLILFTVLLLGALHAVVFLPVVLAWIGPQPQTTPPAAEADGEGEDGLGRDVEAGKAPKESKLSTPPASVLSTEPAPAPVTTSGDAKVGSHHSDLAMVLPQ